MLNFKIIQSLFPPAIFERGLRLFHDNHIKHYQESNGTINARVKGDRNTTYFVTVEIKREGIVSGCTCPYGGLCKHLCAVLLYYIDYIEKQKDAYGADEFAIDYELEQAENHLKQVGDAIPQRKEKEIFIKDQLHIEESTNHVFFSATKMLEKPEKENAASSGQRFKLIFVIEVETSRKSKFIIVPMLQFIKKDGTYGRIEKYSRNKMVEPISETKNLLLNLMEDNCQFETLRYDLLTALPLMTSRNGPALYVDNTKEYDAVELVPIERLKIIFRIASLQRNTYNFAPIIQLLDKDGKPLTGYITKFECGIEGFAYCFLTDTGKLYYTLEDYVAIGVLNAIFKRNKLFSPLEIKNIIDKYSRQSVNNIEVMLPLEKIKKVSYKPEVFLKINDEGDILEMSVFVKYKDTEVRIKHYDKMLLENYDPESTQAVQIERNYEFEQAVYFYLDRLFTIMERGGGIILNPFAPGPFGGEDKPDFTLFMYARVFIKRFGKELINNNIAVKFKDGKKNISARMVKVIYKITTGIDWFDLTVKAQNDDGIEEEIYIDDMILEGFINIGGEYRLLSQDTIEKLVAAKKGGLTVNGTMKLHKCNFYLIDKLYNDIVNRPPDFEESKKIAQALADFKGIEDYPLPKHLNGTLRHYQKAGFNWLSFLHQYNLNGCLADDMGLGKTVQALALLLSLKEQNVLKTSLLIVPVSTIPNWESEIDRFTPGLSHIRHIGPQRKKQSNLLQNYDMVITSYHTMARDIGFLKDIEFYYIVLDEAHYIKNAATDAFKSVKILKSRHRLSLTGTPVENNTMELWAQMDFLNSGLLGDRSDFMIKYAKPIEKHGSIGAAQELKEIVSPFILRRKKEDVAKDLPEKEEIILYVEMGYKQQKVYDSYKLETRKKIEALIASKGISRSSIEIFEAMLKLRQICLFPELVSHVYKDCGSCKFENLKDMLNEIISEGHKVLVFSQFVVPLKIIETYLKSQSIAYSYLDGSTTNRKAVIDRFQNDENIKVFLLSIKAGGVGVNLTAADYVILFDPWWNPAVENQAIDRAHRIGQTKKVIAYKYIVKNTIEEKILKLQDKKQKLVRELITAEKTFFKSLEKEDILRLFE